MNEAVVEKDRFVQAASIAVVALSAVVGFHIWATRYTATHKREIQNTLDQVVRPVRNLLLHTLPSRQEYAEEDISAYHWINGAPPDAEESPEFLQLMENGFRDWRLEVKGLVDNPLSLSLDDIRVLPKQEQITKHICVQGWTGIGKWGGTRFSEIIERCKPMPQARYAVFFSYGLDQFTVDNKPRQPFYTVIDFTIAQQEQTLLAYELNNQPLPLPHGLPLRLRLETQLGYKMVKYLRSIEFVEDYKGIGEGKGGSREDTMYYSELNGDI